MAALLTLQLVTPYEITVLSDAGDKTCAAILPVIGIQWQN